jgi:hypothetical protein
VWAFVIDAWKKQLDFLVEETLSFVRIVGRGASKKIDFPQLRFRNTLLTFPDFDGTPAWTKN